MRMKSSMEYNGEEKIEVDRMWWDKVNVGLEVENKELKPALMMARELQSPVSITDSLTEW